MKLTKEQISLLKSLMTSSAQKGNLANAGLVIENGNTIASSESLVVTNHDATAHSERMLVAEVGKMKNSNFTPGLIMVTVVEPCIMCMSACSQGGFSEVAYIIPAKRYIEKIPWMSDTNLIDKNKLAGQFSNSIKLTHLAGFEEEFSKVFEKVMDHLLQK